MPKYTVMRRVSAILTMPRATIPASGLEAKQVSGERQAFEQTAAGGVVQLEVGGLPRDTAPSQRTSGLMAYCRL